MPTKTSTRTKSQRGRRAREHGAEFERKIANEIRDRFDVTVKRNRQSDRAYDSDISVLEVTGVLARIWWECNNEIKPNPRKKLAQAEKDISELPEGYRNRIPVIVWQKKRAKTIQATMRLGSLLEIAGLPPVHRGTAATVIELDVLDFFHLLNGAVHREH